MISIAKSLLNTFNTLTSLFITLIINFSDQNLIKWKYPCIYINSLYKIIMNQVRNIIVTGSNKGIGYGIVDYLAKSSNWNIIMACRNVELANNAKE
jgi:hypothetical protein